MKVLDLQAGEAQRELGLFATELNNQDFVAKARAIAREISARKGYATVDDVRVRIEQQPNSSHTWGCIFHEPGWRCVGMEPSQVKTNRARRILRWEWRP